MHITEHELRRLLSGIDKACKRSSGFTTGKQREAVGVLITDAIENAVSINSILDVERGKNISMDRVASKMLTSEMSDEDICYYTGVSEIHLRKLKDENQKLIDSHAK